MRKFIYGILVLIVVVAILLVATDVVLYSNIPKSIVQSKLQKALGLDVQINSISVGIFGHSDIYGVNVTLPLSNKTDGDTVLKVKKLSVNHANLVSLIMGAIDITRLDFYKPTINIRKTSNGNLNLQKTIALLTHSALGNMDSSDQALQLPEISIHNGTILVDLADKRSSKNSAFKITKVYGKGVLQDNLEYQVNLNLPKLAKINGKVSMASPYAHDINFKLTPEAKLLTALFGKVEHSNFKYIALGKWHGKMVSSGLQGHLDIKRLKIPYVYAHGKVNIHYGDRETTISPVDLKVKKLFSFNKTIEAVSGKLRYKNGGFILDNLLLKALGGKILANGKADLFNIAGNAKLKWTNLKLPQGVARKGSLTLQTKQDKFKQRKIHVQVDAYSKTGSSQLHTVVDANASGQKWGKLGGKIAIKNNALKSHSTKPHNPVKNKLTQIRASFSVAVPAVRIDNLHLISSSNSDSINGQAKFNWKKRTFNFSFDGNNIPLHEGLILNSISAVGRGNQNKIKIAIEETKINGAEVKAKGSYVYKNENPLNINIQLKPALFNNTKNKSIIYGDDIKANLRIEGGISPLNLDATGKFFAKNLHINKKDIGNVKLLIKAKANKSQVELSSDKSKLFDGNWKLDAKYLFSKNHLTAHLKANNIDLQKAQAIMPAALNLSNLTGKAGLVLNFNSKAFDLSKTKLDGFLKASNVGYNLINIDSASAKINLSKGAVYIKDIQAKRRQGKFQGEATFKLNKPGLIKTKARLVDWPLLESWNLKNSPLVDNQFSHIFKWIDCLNYNYPSRLKADTTPTRAGSVPFKTAKQKAVNRADDRLILIAKTAPSRSNSISDFIKSLNITANGKLHGKINIHDKQGKAQAQLLIKAKENNLSLGGVDMKFELKKKLLSLTNLTGKLRNSDITGSGKVNLSKPLETAVFDFKINKFHPDKLTYINPAFADITGNITTHISIHPNDNPNPLGPLLAKATIKANDVGYNKLHFLDGKAIAYFGRGRYVLKSLNLNAGGGKVKIWARLNSHLGKKYFYVSASADNLNLGAIVNTFISDQMHIAGKLNINRFTFATRLGDWNNTFGKASISVKDSNFVSIPLFSSIYNFINFSGNHKGHGKATLRLDQGRLMFIPIEYKRDGLRLRMFGHIKDLWKGTSSDIRAIVFASQSPLPQIKAFSFINHAFRIIQSGVTTLGVNGTLKNPNVHTMAFKNLGNTLGGILDMATIPFAPTSQ